MYQQKRQNKVPGMNSQTPSFSDHNFPTTKETREGKTRYCSGKNFQNTENELLLTCLVILLFDQTSLVMPNMELGAFAETKLQGCSSDGEKHSCLLQA